MKRNLNLLIIIILTAALLFSCLPAEIKAETTLADPKIEAAGKMASGQKVTWDCIWFGSYPQTEIVDKGTTSGVSGKAFASGSDYVVDESLYKSLQSASGWTGNELSIDGTKYRRLKRADATYATSGNDGYYDWDSSYHYFRYEKIKWRVLDVSGDKVLLLADKALDDQKYNADEAAIWAAGTMRSWLNGYGPVSNTCGNDYRNRSFIGAAFSSAEQGAILTTKLANTVTTYDGKVLGEDTSDKVFLLAESDVDTGTAKTYGFVPNKNYDEARRCRCSTYAKAMGANTAYWDDNKGFCWWILRSPGPSYYSAYIDYTGVVYSDGEYVYKGICAVRPALYLDLSSSASWSYAGTVCSDGTVKEQSPEDLSPEKSVVKVSGIKLSGISHRIAAGKKIRLTAKVLPGNAKNKKLRWTSSNKKVATVTQSGRVSVKKKTGGKTVVIKANATDGSKKTAAWKIRIMKGSVKKISVKGAKKKLKAGKTMKLKVVVKTSGGKANKKVKWTSDNKNYATVTSSGKVKALKTGKGRTVKITVRSTDGSNIKKTVKIKIK